MAYSRFFACKFLYKGTFPNACETHDKYDQIRGSSINASARNLPSVHTAPGLESGAALTQESGHGGWTLSVAKVVVTG